MTSLPPEWVELATRKGIRASARGIADASGIAVTTVRRLVSGGKPLPETVRRVAETLGVDQQQILDLAGIATGPEGFWDLPLEAHQLNGPTRGALAELIRTIVKGATDGRQPDAEKTPGPDAEGPACALGGQGPTQPDDPVSDDLSKQREKRIPKPQSKAARRRKSPPETDR